jgi:excinuclease UvrABC nuclease subunit
MNYVDNVYAMLQRRGLSQKYEYPGIYCIKVNHNVVYVGKSINMLKRVA